MNLPFEPQHNQIAFLDAMTSTTPPPVVATGAAPTSTGVGPSTTGTTETVTLPAPVYQSLLDFLAELTRRMGAYEHASLKQSLRISALETETSTLRDQIKGLKDSAVDQGEVRRSELIEPVPDIPVVSETKEPIVEEEEGDDDGDDVKGQGKMDDSDDDDDDQSPPGKGLTGSDPQPPPSFKPTKENRSPEKRRKEWHDASSSR